MITIRAEQMETIAQLLFYGRLKRLVAVNGLRADWKTWMSDTARVHAIWDQAWTAARGHSEHDCALCLVFLAIRAFEGIPIGDTDGLLGQIAAQEVAIKRYIADRGYLRFTAFDYPDGVPDEDPAHV